MTATPFRTIGLGAVLALVASLASAQQPPMSPPPPNTMQAPNPMTMQPGSQPMANPQVTSQGDPMQRACRQKWKEAVASGAKNGQTRQQFLSDCMQGH
jgi:hypothetical protein